jgi:hypothetical protein
MILSVDFGHKSDTVYSLHPKKVSLEAKNVSDKKSS